MNNNAKAAETQRQNEERIAQSVPGMPILILNIALTAVFTVLLIKGAVWMDTGENASLGTLLLAAGIVWYCVPCWMLIAGLKVVKPNEAYVFTLFGKYHGSLIKDGFYFVNPFVSATNPLKVPSMLELAAAGGKVSLGADGGKDKDKTASSSTKSSKISTKVMTLSNNKQKINDLLGNPIEIGIVVVWRVVNTARAVFNVDNFEEFLSMQCDTALRNIVRLYPYDVPGEEEGEASLRGSSQEIAEKLKGEIQKKVDVAGLDVIEARITHLAYAPEIAAAMLQRQQASAIVDARTLIVKGAVGMVKQALAELDENEIVNLDEERKAAMVSNLLVVLCGNKDAQPIVNSGTLY
jgi:regulator of protease activity HflC (stomatin/prohibitin superfamily)